MAIVRKIFNRKKPKPTIQQFVLTFQIKVTPQAKLEITQPVIMQINQ